MSSVFALVVALVVAVLGYRWYAGYIDANVIKADPKRATPAKMYMDGVDFIPTGRHVLFGYQFKSIAALGPITGPIVAMKWGWLPALAWILGGALLFGWAHDYASAFLTIRNDGQSFGALSYRLISPRGRATLLAFIYFYLLLILAAFGSIVANMLVKNPVVPVAIVALMITGTLAGQAIYRKRMDIIAVTLVMVALSLVGVWLGTIWKIPIASFDLWLLFTLFFCYLGAVLPIWAYAQPINYISFYLVALGMLGAIIGIFLGRPPLTLPAYTGFFTKTGEPLWPLLFVTIACGAISGWHSLVSSSGTGRQIENERDVKYVAAGAMFTEMVLATLAVIIAAGAVGANGFAEAMKGGPANVFTQGMASLLGFLGIGQTFGVAFAGAMFAILAITIMQLVVRFMRVATVEIAGEKVPILGNMHVGALLALFLGYVLVKTGTWNYIWTLFGGSNQLMAALALMLASIWLAREGKAWGWTFYPMLFMLATTIVALAVTAHSMVFTVVPGLQAGTVVPPAGQSVAAAIAGNYIAAAIGVFLIVAALILAYDGLRAFFKVKGEKASQAAAPSHSA
ncbi:MAG: carbon starvation CstA family protein [Bacillota bacterium]|nr:carbon starvation CstA family protein [Bacillota bacterium]